MQCCYENVPFSSLFFSPIVVGFEFHFIVQGIARTQSPLRKNYALESPTFVVIAEVNLTEVQWKGLTLDRLPSWSQFSPCQVSMLGTGSPGPSFPGPSALDAATSFAPGSRAHKWWSSNLLTLPEHPRLLRRRPRPARCQQGTTSAHNKTSPLSCLAKYYLVCKGE